MGNRESLLTFIGPDIVAARWKQWRIYFRDMARTGTGQQMVGGIFANDTYPVDFFEVNMKIAMNIIQWSHVFCVKKLMVLGSSCIYPKQCNQPIKEEYLNDGLLEPTNEAYAIAKIAAIKLCQYYNKQYGSNFISVMPCSLYGGINESFDLNNSHLIPAIMRKMHEAKTNNLPTVEVWGSGKPRREFMHVDDFADAAVFLMNNYNSSELINVGIGRDLTINMIVNLIKHIVGYKGEIVYNLNKPDGVMQKLLDCSKMNDLGWQPQIEFTEGLKMMYKWAVNEVFV
jgi:GDP-L-fucose synthase